MTEEILNKAHDYARNNIERTEEGGYDIIEKMRLVDAYLAGAKDNAAQWHYPSKGELPEDDRLVVIYYKGGVADFGSYALGLNGWHNKFGDSISEPYMWIRIKPPKEM